MHQRSPSEGLVHHSDRGVQYLSIRYTDRLLEAGIEPSVGSVGDSYDNALAESVIGLYKTEVIRRRGPWRSVEAVEYATLEWVDWFNRRRLLEPIGYIPPLELESGYYQSQSSPVMDGCTHVIESPEFPGRFSHFLRLALATSRTLHRADRYGSWCRRASTVAATMADGVDTRREPPGRCKAHRRCRNSDGEWSSGSSQPVGL